MAPYVPVKKQNGDWGHLNNETTNPIAWIRDGGYRKVMMKIYLCLYLQTGKFLKD